MNTYDWHFWIYTNRDQINNNNIHIQLILASWYAIVYSCHVFCVLYSGSINWSSVYAHQSFIALVLTNNIALPGYFFHSCLCDRI